MRPSTIRKETRMKRKRIRRRPGGTPSGWFQLINERRNGSSDMSQRYDFKSARPGTWGSLAHLLAINPSYLFISILQSLWFSGKVKERVRKQSKPVDGGVGDLRKHPRPSLPSCEETKFARQRQTGARRNSREQTRHQLPRVAGIRLRDHFPCGL